MNNLLSEALKVTHYDFDPDGTSAVDVGWVDMRDFHNFMVSFFRTVGTSALTYKILGNAQSNGGGTDVVIKTKTLTGVQPDAVGDYSFLEATIDEIIAAGKAAGIDVRYVSANLTFATGTDEAVVTYIRGGAKKPQGSLTADAIA